MAIREQVQQVPGRGALVIRLGRDARIERSR
jgi:hypothetical protein